MEWLHILMCARRFVRKSPLTTELKMSLIQDVNCDYIRTVQSAPLPDSPPAYPAFRNWPANVQQIAPTFPGPCHSKSLTILKNEIANIMTKGNDAMLQF